IAPFLFGDKNAPTLIGTGLDFLPRTIRCSLREMKIVGHECFLTYRIRHASSRRTGGSLRKVR
ncbi:MAG TPA: hypothetical protein VFJ55_00930, partial [Chthoniobacterales bacterium]|nr:hypothetical protein [Chthoniobacterales bacterium]